MKTKSIFTMDTIIVFVIFAMIISTTVFAAEIIVTPGLNTLKQAIAAGTAGDVFILQRGAGYVNQDHVVTTYPLTLRASKGDGPKPVVKQVARNDGSYNLDQDFSVGGDFTAINIHFNGERGDGTFNRRTIRTYQPNIKVVIDSCWFDTFSIRGIALNAPDNIAYFTNSIWVNMLQEGIVGNGRPIDCRNFGHDTVFVQNCSFVNTADRMFRHYGSSLVELNNVIIDHCTFVNGYGFRPDFQFTWIEKLQFTSNLLINLTMLGSVITDARRIGEVFIDEKDIRTFTATKTDSFNTVINMLNNNIWLDPQIKALHATNDSITTAELFNKEFKDKIVNRDKAYFEEEVTFTNVPEPPMGGIEYYIGVWGREIPLEYWNLTKPTEIDLSYATTATSYTAGSGGFPIGDLNWFPEKRKEWEDAGKPTSVQDKIANVPDAFQVHQNYPNPFNPITTIEYTLSRSGHVTLTVFNMLGQKLKTLVDEKQYSGINSAQWDGTDENGNFMPSGIFYYKIETGGASETHKMLLIK